MNINTIMNILYQNGMENVVALAVQLDNNIPFTGPQVGDSIIVEVSNDKIKSLGKKFKDRSYGYISCPIVAINHHKLDDKYLITLPDGSTKWTRTSDRTSNESETIDLVQVSAE